jgi:hypothetical protein
VVVGDVMIKAKKTKKAKESVLSEEKKIAPQGPADFSTPWEVTDVQIVFPSNTVERMPSYEVAQTRNTRFDTLFSEWFYYGIKIKEVTAKPGIDPEKAIRHIQSIMGGFDSKHEHKSDAVSYLLDKWFENIEYEVVRK